MNINRKIVNRALLKIGDTPLSEEDQTSALFETAKLLYLSTYLEALESYVWTSAKTRKTLAIAATMNFTDYSHAYDLPVDCSRALELQNNEYFIIEGRTLYTSIPDAVLLYIRNGRRAENEYVEEEDYPEYTALDLEAEFNNFLETRLASKFALKITGKDQLYATLFNEAAMIGRAASMTSKSASAAKKNGESWWTERIH